MSQTPHASAHPTDANLYEADINPPRPFITDMYLEINSIAQGLNIGLLVLFFSKTDDIFKSLAAGYFSAPMLAVANLLISIVFWTRYYFDTEILKRSHTVFSTSWFFLYVLSQAVSISFIYDPAAWLASTGVFLFFGFGFYVLNLREIGRKQKAGIVPGWPNFVHWQRRRMLDLLALSGTSLVSAFFVSQRPALALPAAVMALVIAVWQLAVTNDYRAKRFIKTGV